MTITPETLLNGAIVPWQGGGTPLDMSGTNVRTTEPFELGRRTRHLSAQPSWVDISLVIGEFTFEISNDLVEWTPLVIAGADRQVDALGPAVNGNDGTQFVQTRVPVNPRYGRLIYTNTSGTGTLVDGVPVQGKEG